jgi:hypothetical protein
VGSAPRHSVILTPIYVRTEWVFDFKPAHTPEREREVHGTKKMHEAYELVFTMRFSRYGLGASSPLITTPQYQR